MFHMRKRTFLASIKESNEGHGQTGLSEFFVSSHKPNITIMFYAILAFIILWSSEVFGIKL